MNVLKTIYLFMCPFIYLLIIYYIIEVAESWKQKNIYLYVYIYIHIYYLLMYVIGWGGYTSFTICWPDCSHDFIAELSNATAVFAKSCAMLGNAEEHTALSRAISQLAETEENIEQLQSSQAATDFYVLSELLKDYIGLIAAVRVSIDTVLYVSPGFASHST